jgi:D-arabinose 1-dehydrogenase-like Zn-dependent alcohol dehydrogenase
MLGRAAVFRDRAATDPRAGSAGSGAGEAILIKVTMAGVCGSDLHFWRGDSPVFGALPN